MSTFCSHECTHSLSHTTHATVSASRPHSAHLLRDRVLSLHTWALLDACNEEKHCHMYSVCCKCNSHTLLLYSALFIRARGTSPAAPVLARAIFQAPTIFLLKPKKKYVFTETLRPGNLSFFARKVVKRHFDGYLMQ